MPSERDPHILDGTWAVLPSSDQLPPTVEQERDLAVIDAMRSLATLAEDMAQLCRALNDSLVPLADELRKAQRQSGGKQ
jgi:hypothetical protein